MLACLEQLRVLKKIVDIILNKELIEQLNTIKGILFKKITTQLILLTTTILKVIFLQKKSILKIEIFSLNLFAKSLIDNLIIN